MPWNDQSEGPNGPGQGPWGGGPRKPWGQPTRPPQRPAGPDLEDWLRQLRERISGGGGGGGMRGERGPISWQLIVGILLVGWLVTGTYFVNEGEQAVITRLGRYDRTTGPGAHWRMPPPIETLLKYNVTGQRSDEIGCDRTRSQCEDPEEGLMLTGDRNIVDIHFKVYYNISNAVDFAFNVRDPIDVDRDENQGAVRQVVESSMREVVGRRQLEAVITTDRALVEQEVQGLAQQVLDSYDAGVRIIQVQLLNATVPPDVIAAFNDVINANQDAETAVNNANRDSSRIVNEAEAYRGRVIRQAQGDAEGFTSVYNQYRLAPQVTRDRIYLETMERVYQRGNLVILDQHSGAVPYLPLEGMVRRPAAAPPQGNR